MGYRGNPSVLFGLENRHAIEIHTGGGMSCVWNLGFKVALAKAGLVMPKAVVGVSGGACNGAAGMSAGKDWRTLTRVLDVYKYLSEGGFFKRKLCRFGWYLDFDVEELVAALEGKRSQFGLPELDEAAIQRHPSPFWVAVTSSKNAQGTLKNAKPQLFRALRATMSVPGSCAPASVDSDELYYDGAWGSPLPGSAIKQFWARKVLVIMSQPPPADMSTWELMHDLTTTFFANLHVPSELSAATWRMNKEISSVIRRIERCQRIEVLIVYPDRGMHISPLTTCPRMLQKAFENGEEAGEKLIAQARVA